MSSAAVASPSSTTSTSSTTLVSKQQLDSRTNKNGVTEVKLSASSVTEPKQQLGALPGDLRRILLEVAKTGTSSILTWNEGQENSSNRHGGINSNNLGGTVVLSRPKIAAIVPSRKKHRNKILNNRRRLENSNSASNNSASSSAASSVSRKRPLMSMVARSPSALLPSASSAASVGSSGRTSGSELDDVSTHAYECDSEGTSATTNSELSDRERSRRKHHRYGGGGKMSSSTTSTSSALQSMTTKYKSMREALKAAVGLVLDHSYRTLGGYKLSSAEIRKYHIEESGKEGNENSGTNKLLSPEEAFSRRRKLLVSLVGDEGSRSGQNHTAGGLKNGDSKPSAKTRTIATAASGPPFTIQRIAEVLVAPERYYKQTHKLCNCLEKLLLVSSSIEAFGGSSGGESSQTRREERELLALKNEKERLESEQRNRRLRMRRMSSDDVAEKQQRDGSPGRKQSPDGSNRAADPSSDSKSLGLRESLEAVAKAQLRTKFDHVGLDSHQPGAAQLLNPTVEPAGTTGAATISRGMTNSPPPPSLASSVAAMPANFVRHLAENNHQHNNATSLTGKSKGDGSAEKKSSHSLHTHDQYHGPLVPRAPSPILGMAAADTKKTSSRVIDSSGGGASNNPLMNANHNLHVLHMHHHASFPGVSLASGGSGSSSSPLDIVIDRSSSNHGAEGNDRGSESGRSSASNSDVDSEPDDVSLEDSTLDDSPTQNTTNNNNYEPFTAARVMALNRMQQQQRLQASRLALHGATTDFRPPADHEYQSSDSIDSMMAEDSGGSDSSSSDLAD